VKLSCGIPISDDMVEVECSSGCVDSVSDVDIEASGIVVLDMELTLVEVFVSGLELMVDVDSVAFEVLVSPSREAEIIVVDVAVVLVAVMSGRAEVLVVGTVVADSETVCAVADVNTFAAQNSHVIIIVYFANKCSK